MEHQNKDINVSTGKRTKKLVEYEYVPILGNILGYWRVAYVQKLGERIELNLNTPLTEYDDVIINGVKIEIPKDALNLIR